jgi:glyoxylase-like metal-dependent hydrolase (beta-lactamase superfamily II)
VTADVLVDCEGTFATYREAFPAIHSDVDWWLPVNGVLLRSVDLLWRELVEQALAERPHLREKVVPLEPRVERVTGETEIAPGIRVQPAPGHTPGHMLVRAGPYAVIGDIIAHEFQVVDPDLVFVNDMDFDVAAATRRRVIAELAEEGASVIAGHFPGTGRFERAGKGFRWAVE